MHPSRDDDALAQRAAAMRRAAEMQAEAREATKNRSTAEAKPEEPETIAVTAGGRGIIPAYADHAKAEQAAADQDKAAPDEPHYMTMKPGEMLKALGDDAHKWATAFCQQWPGWSHGLMESWFANAIEASHDARIARMAPATIPAGERIGGQKYSGSGQTRGDRLSPEEELRERCLQTIFNMCRENKAMAERMAEPADYIAAAGIFYQFVRKGSITFPMPKPVPVNE